MLITPDLMDEVRNYAKERANGFIPYFEIRDERTWDLMGYYVLAPKSLAVCTEMADIFVKKINPDWTQGGCRPCVPTEAETVMEICQVPLYVITFQEKLELVAEKERRREITRLALHPTSKSLKQSTA